MKNITDYMVNESAGFALNANYSGKNYSVAELHMNRMKKHCVVFLEEAPQNIVVVDYNNDKDLINYFIDKGFGEDDVNSLVDRIFITQPGQSFESSDVCDEQFGSVYIIY